MRLALACTMLLAALASAACHTMSPVTLAQLSAMKPERAWLKASDQSVMVMQGPQVVGDTLVGYVNGRYEEIPTSQVGQMIVQVPAKTRTVLLAVGIAVGIGGFAYAITGATGGDKYVGSDYCEEHPEDPACVSQ